MLAEDVAVLEGGAPRHGGLAPGRGQLVVGLRRLGVGEQKQLVADCAAAFLEDFRRRNAEEYPDVKTVVLGPLAPKVSKVNDRYRQRVIIKTKNTARFRRFVREVMERIFADKNYKTVTVFADMNPENMN